jgi:hypothetical protein
MGQQWRLANNSLKNPLIFPATSQFGQLNCQEQANELMHIRLIGLFHFSQNGSVFLLKRMIPGL